MAIVPERYRQWVLPAIIFLLIIVGAFLSSRGQHYMPPPRVDIPDSNMFVKIPHASTADYFFFLVPRDFADHYCNRISANDVNCYVGNAVASWLTCVHLSSACGYRLPRAYLKNTVNFLSGVCMKYRERNRPAYCQGCVLGPLALYWYGEHVDSDILPLVRDSICPHAVWYLPFVLKDYNIPESVASTSYLKPNVRDIGVIYATGLVCGDTNLSSEACSVFCNNAAWYADHSRSCFLAIYYTNLSRVCGCGDEYLSTVWSGCGDVNRFSTFLIGERGAA